MQELLTTEVDRWKIHVVATDRSDGDMHPERVAPDVLAARQRAVAGTVWPMLDQVHGAAVVALPSARSAPIGDVAVVRPGGTPVAVWAADCAPIAVIGARGTVGMIHAGWRGLAADVISAGVDAVIDADREVVGAVLGPSIHACCYEFGDAELAEVARGVGAERGQVRARTSWGTPALDVPAAVRVGLARYAVDLAVVGPCTGCDERWFSHRRRLDSGRHALVAWTEVA